MRLSVIRHPVLRKIAPLLVAAACATSGTLPPPRPALSPETYKQLRCAAENQTTAPSYVWVDVNDPESGRRWSAAVESSVVWADLRSNPNTRFELDARPDLVPSYDERLLNAARRHLTRFSDSEIARGFSRDSQFGDVREFTRESSIFLVQPSEMMSRKEALAHALFERGFYPSRGDYVPTLYASGAACPKPREPDPIWNGAADELPARP